MRLMANLVGVISGFAFLTACASTPKLPANQQEKSPVVVKSTTAKRIQKKQPVIKPEPKVFHHIVYVKPVEVKPKRSKSVSIHGRHYKNKSLTGAKAVQYANHKAQRQPNTHGFTNAIMTYNFSPGALYQVYTAPLDITDLEFAPNERIVSVAAGDTLRWQVSKTYSGEDADYREHILIKPTASGLTNSLVVTTDQRTYHFQLHSTPDTYMAVVDWRYPKERVKKKVSVIKTQSQMLNALNVKSLHFDYQIALKSGPRPGWVPLRVFDDGSKTYIQFPAGMQSAPLLYIGHSPNSDRIVNYRVEGNYYVIDSVVDNAQLRLGQTAISVVQITRIPTA